jgi:hypothetical protein
MMKTRLAFTPVREPPVVALASSQCSKQTIGWKPMPLLR